MKTALFALRSNEILCSLSSYFLLPRPLRVERLACLQDAIREVNELTHCCPDDTHLALASVAQRFRLLLEKRTAPQHRDGRKVERLAKPGVADPGEPHPPLTELADCRSRGTSPAKAATCRALLYFEKSGNSPKITAAVVSAIPGIESSNSR